MVKITIGNSEKHEVSFDYSTMTGTVKILVDGKESSSSKVLFIGHTPFILQVGESEKHKVTIELDNPLFFAFRGSNVKILVDDQLVSQDHIGGSMWLLIMIMMIPVIYILVYFVATFFLRNIR